MSPPVDEQYIRFTVETNALDYLEKAARFLETVEEHPRDWKWVVLGLHGSLYGFAIAACSGTSVDNVTRDDGYLIGFWEALDRCQDPDWMNMLIDSQPLSLSDRQSESIDTLKNLLRNNFEHLSPTLWAIEIHGLPRMAINVLRVIEFLALETHTHVQLNGAQREKVRRLVSDSIARIREMDLYQEARTATDG